MFLSTPFVSFLFYFGGRLEDKHFCVNVTVPICSVWNNINNDLKNVLVHQTLYLYYNDVNMPALASVGVTNDKVVKKMPISIVINNVK